MPVVFGTVYAKLPFDMAKAPLFGDDEPFLVWDAFRASLLDEYEVVSDAHSRYATAFMVAWAYGQLDEGLVGAPASEPGSTSRVRRSGP